MASAFCAGPSHPSSAVAKQMAIDAVIWLLREISTHLARISIMLDNATLSFVVIPKQPVRIISNLLA